MPAAFPAWARVCALFRRWREPGLIAEFHDRLRGTGSEREGREAEPTAGINRVRLRYGISGLAGRLAATQRRLPPGIMSGPSLQVGEQVLRRAGGRVLRRADRSQGGGEPCMGCLRQVRVGKEGKDQQEAGGCVLDAFGRG